MQLDTSTIPHGLMQILGLVLASSLGWLGGWITRRRREPIEIKKIQAETRSIETATDVSLLQAATQAIAGAERLRSERDHWERKATDLMLDLEDERNRNAQQATRLTLHEHQMKRLKGLLDAHEISYSELDKPRASD
jgi:hypothetical protein